MRSELPFHVELPQTAEELLQVETASRYPALHRLEVKVWITASWELPAKWIVNPAGQEGQ